MAQVDGGQCRQRLPWLQARAAANARKPAGIDRQHVVGLRVDRVAQHDRLQRIQGGAVDADQVGRAALRARRLGYPLQFDPPDFREDSSVGRHCRRPRRG